MILLKQEMLWMDAVINRALMPVRLG
jgi:hypothetical protein